MRKFVSKIVVIALTMCMFSSVLGSGAFALEKSTIDDEIIAPMYITVEVYRHAMYYVDDPYTFVPPSSIYWTENGLSGTLYYYSHYVAANGAIKYVYVTYKGTLIGQP